MRLCARLLLAIALLAGGTAAGAQEFTTSSGTDWLPAWSPLRRVADLPRGATGVLLVTPSLLSPYPLIGQFWSGGNPAALPREIASPYAEFGVRRAGVSGDFRRPLDAPESSSTGAAAVAWRPFNESVGLIGRASFDESRIEPGTQSIAPDPYATAPFLVTDSTRSPQRSSRVRLEGAGGWRRGRLSAGVSAGYEAVESSTISALVPRFGRGTRPGIVVGATHDLTASTRLGAFARWTRNDATLQMFGTPGITVVTLLNGYAAPSVTLVAPNLNALYYRRVESSARAAGITADGTPGRWRWAVYAGAGTVTDASWSQQQDQPPRDVWQATTLSGGGALHGPLDHGATLLTLRVEWVGLAGDARTAALDSVVYRAAEHALRGAFDVRWRAPASPWLLRGTVAFTYENYDRGDTIPNVLRTQVESITTRVSADAARDIGSRFDVSAGYSLTTYAPRGTLPLPANYPAPARALFGGENAFHAARSLAHSASATAGWSANAQTTFRLVASRQSVSPRHGGVALEPLPFGQRSAWHVSAMAVIR